MERVNGGRDVHVFQGGEIKVTGEPSLVGPSIRLVLLPEVAQCYTFILSDGASHTPLGQVSMEREEMLKHYEAQQQQSVLLARPSASGGSVEALAESLYAEPRMSLSIEAGLGTRLVARPGEGVRAQSSAVVPGAGIASVGSSPCDALLSPSGVQWAEWPAFRRQTGSVLPSQADADVLEVALAASWLASLNTFTKSSPIVSLHTSPALGGLLLDHTEVVVRDHAPVFRNKILLDPRALAALDPKAEVVIRVYDVEAASVEGPGGAVVIPPGAKALVGETAPISVATLLAYRDAGERASFLLSNTATPALDKKLQKKGACVVLAVGRPGQTKSIAAPLQVSIPRPVSQFGSGSSISNVVASSSKANAPVVSSSTPYGGASGALAVDADQVVLVDAQGKEHRAPKVKAEGAGAVSISVAASNLPKLHAMSTTAAPLVALWERVPEGEYVLLSHTEPSSGADPHFQRALTTAAAALAFGSAADHPEQFRVDVFDLGHGEARVSLAQDRVAFAFLSRAELEALVGAVDHAERTVALRSDRGATWERKLAQRGAVLQLSRADTPAEKVAERQAARARAMEVKRIALKQKKEAWVAARSGVLPAAASKQPPIAIAESAGAAASPAPQSDASSAAAAASAAFATPVKSTKDASSSLGSGFNLPPMSSSRRGSLTDVEAESIADMEGALLAEKVALARLEAARAALAGIEAKGKNAKAKRDRAAAEAEVEAAQAELTAASERAAVAKETLAARRRQRAELSEAEARARAETDAENASNPNYTPWGMRKRGNSVQHERLTPGSAGNSRPGSAANSRRQSLSLSSGAAADNSRTDIRELVLARRMAAAAAAAAATSSPDALLPARPAGSRSTIFALQVSVRNVKNTGAWNPCVAVYEKATAAASADESAASDHKQAHWVYLDHTEKVAGIGETGAGSFTRQMLVEYFPADADDAAQQQQQQQLRFCLYNAGAKDEASASDLIGSGCVPLGELAALLGSAGSNRAVEVFLSNSGNRAVSERLKRQQAAIVLRLAQSVEEGQGDAASRGQRLLLTHAPVPLRIEEGGADPDPAAKPFALAEAEAQHEAAPAPDADQVLSEPAGSEVAASASAVAAPETDATAAAASQGDEAAGMAITVDAEPAAVAAADATIAAAAPEKEAEQPAAAAEAALSAGHESVEASPVASVDLAQQPEQRDALAAEAATLAASDEALQQQPEEPADAAGDADADAAEPAAAASAAGAAASSDAQKKKKNKKKKGGK